MSYPQQLLYIISSKQQRNYDKSGIIAQFFHNQNRIPRSRILRVSTSAAPCTSCSSRISPACRSSGVIAPTSNRTIKIGSLNKICQFWRPQIVVIIQLSYFRSNIPNLPPFQSILLIKDITMSLLILPKSGVYIKCSRKVGLLTRKGRWYGGRAAITSDRLHMHTSRWKDCWWWRAMWR